MGASLYSSENFNEYRDYIMKLGEDNSRTHSILKKNLRRAIREELTEKQWEAMRLYYVEQIKMSDIADILGVNTSTVSRNIKRGRERLKKCLKYGARELISQLPDD